ncbi:hypothetical protein MMC13_005484 [Lambiella insularis]|nr:hypothetical protein [Lambiella insularis]
MSDSATVLICGAGISGLALAQGLLKARIAFRVFEREPVFNARAQGYRVRINSTGIAALKQILPPELFSPLTASCAQITSENANKIGPTISLNALTGEKQLEPMGSGPPSKHGPVGQEDEPLSADRTVLRNVLILGLEGYVEFGKEFSKYEFCQMAWLPISVMVPRQYLPDHKILDTQGRWICGKTPLTPELVEKFEKKAMVGMTIMGDRSREVPQNLLLEANRFKDNEFRSGLPEDYVYWVLALRGDAIGMDDEEAAALSQKLTSHWNPSFHALFALQDTENPSMIRIVSAEPDMPKWKPSRRLTLMGDAVHVMPPTAGVGATSALRDAAMLTEALKEGGLHEDSIGKYEETMRQYVGEVIAKSRMAGKAMFGMPEFAELKPVRISAGSPSVDHK